MAEQTCECNRKCPHGDRCLGGHAYHPDSHWYPCPKCTPAEKTTVEKMLAASGRRRRKRRR